MTTNTSKPKVEFKGTITGRIVRKKPEPQGCPAVTDHLKFLSR